MPFEPLFFDLQRRRDSTCVPRRGHLPCTYCAGSGGLPLDRPHRVDVAALVHADPLPSELFPKGNAPPPPPTRGGHGRTGGRQGDTPPTVASDGRGERAVRPFLPKSHRWDTTPPSPRSTREPNAPRPPREVAPSRTPPTSGPTVSSDSALLVRKFHPQEKFSETQPQEIASFPSPN